MVCGTDSSVTKPSATTASKPIRQSPTSAGKSRANGPSRYNGKCVKKYLASKTPAERKALMKKWAKPESVHPFDRYYPLSPIYPYRNEAYNKPNSWEIPFDYPKPPNKSNPWRLPVVFEWRIPQNQNRQKSSEPNPCKVLFPDWFKQDIYQDYLRFNPKLKTDSKLSKSNKPIVNVKLKIDKQMPILPLPENSP
jgi:hypothetical protein